MIDVKNISDELKKETIDYGRNDDQAIEVIEDVVATLQYFAYSKLFIEFALKDTINAAKENSRNAIVEACEKIIAELPED